MTLMRWLASLLLLTCLTVAVYGQGSPESKSQLYSETSTNFADNTTGAITPAKLRGVINNMIASMQQISLVNAQTGTTYTVSVADQGKMLTFTSASPVAVTLPSGVTFGNGWSVYFKNNGAGLVTITPSAGTIGGAASLALGTSQGSFVTSDGTNYQTWGGSGTGTVTSVTCGKNLSGGVITVSGTCNLLDDVTLGTSGSIIGVLRQAGSTSGQVLITPQTTAGTPTITWPTATGTVVTTALSPLSINATTGQVSVTTGTLSRVDDTNVTLTLGGTPANALLNAVSLTLGWTGQLSVARGGTNCAVASGTCLDNITGFSSTGIMSRTGAGTYTFSTLTALMDSGLCSTRGSVIYRNATVWACLGPGAAGEVLTTSGVGLDPLWTAVAGTGTVTSVSAGTGMSFTTITASGAVNIDKASTTEVASGTANKVITADTAIGAPAFVSLTTGATVTPDFNAGYNFTLTNNNANFTLALPSNATNKTGRSFCIVITQGSSPISMTLATGYRAPGGKSTIALTAAAGAIDQLCGLVVTGSGIHVTITKNYRG